MASLTRVTLPVNGYEMRMLRGGEGAPLLYLHGAGGAPAVMEFMELLAERFEVIVPEHPGFGASQDPEWFDDIHDLAYYYLDALRGLGFSEVHLVGQSLGGWIALEMAVRDTSRLKSLTLAGAAGLDLDDVPRPDTFMWSPAELARQCFHDPALGGKGRGPGRRGDAGAARGPAQEPAHGRQDRLGAALVRPASGQVAAPH